VRLTSSLVFLSCATLAAQAYVSPSHFTRVEGNNALALGVGLGTAPGRLLQVHDDMAARSISAFAFRRDGQDTSDHLPFSVVMTLAMSTARTTAAQPDATFDANHGTDRRTVFTNQFLQFPAVPYAGFAHPFDYRVPLATPYQHGGGGPLCIDLQIVTRSSSAYYFLDAASGQEPNPGGDTRLLGEGCRVSAMSSRALLLGGFVPNWPTGLMTLSFTGSYLPPATVAALTIGDSATQWGPFPLPFELPGTATAPSGPCTVMNSVLLVFPQLVDAMGGLSATLGYAPHPSMRGRNLYTQLVAPAPTANSWGLVLSNGVEFHPAAPWTAVPIGLVELAGLGGVGNATANSGQIVRFE